MAVEVKFQKRNYNPSKYRLMVDPLVFSAPMGIDLEEDKCIGCGVCVKQCPCQVLAITRRAEPSAFQLPACQYNCPAGIDIRGYLKLIADRVSFDNAWEILTRMNPLPAITGRVCPHPCESACNSRYLNKALNINCIERAVGDYGLEKGLAFEKLAKVNGEKVAVVGSGPSGLSCAYQLAKMGYQVTIFEANSKAGGMLVYAIPSYRLPEGIVEKEIKRILDLGVTLKLNTAVGKDIKLDELKKQFKAVYIAIGAQGNTKMGIEGEDGNVLSGLAFLRSIKEKNPVKIGKKVLVIGGGNAAVDAARVARRLGSNVTILYRRTLAEMPAHAAEVEAAQEEGVKIQFLCAPVKVAGSGNGAVLTCVKMALGEADATRRPRPIPVKGSEFTIECDMLIAAVGQDLNSTGIEGIVGKSKWVVTDSLGKTADQNVFAGGDAVSGPSLVSEAIGAGSKTALAIDGFIRGIKYDEKEKKEISYKDIPLDGFWHLEECRAIQRNDVAKLETGKRRANPDNEETLPFSKEQTVSESRRCLECGQYKPEYTTIHGITYFGKICIGCRGCDAICPQSAMHMKSFYRVDEGRWATGLDIPVEVNDGLPNPLRLPKPLPFKDIEDKITETEKVIYTRRSTRVFKPDPVPRELIERVIEAGRFAPTAGNCIGVKFMVMTDRKLLDELSEAVDRIIDKMSRIYRTKSFFGLLLKRLLCLILPHVTDCRPMAALAGMLHPQFGDKPMDVFFNAPVAIMVIPHALHISDPELDMGLICQNIVLAAHSLGLGTCYVGMAAVALGRDKKTREKFKKKLGLAWPYDKPSVHILLGYPAVRIDAAVPREFPKVEWI